MSHPADTLEPEPVDAEFEPAIDDIGSVSKPATSVGFPIVLVLFVIATMLGGVLGAFGGKYLFPGTEPEPIQTAELAAQDQALTGLETRLAALESEDPAAIVRAEAAQLIGRIEQLESSEPANDTDIQALSVRLTELENASSTAGGNVQDLTSIEARLEAIEAANTTSDILLQQVLDTAATPAQPTTDPTILDNFSQRLSALEAMATQTNSETLGPTFDHAPEIAALTARIDQLETALREARSIADTAQTTATDAAQTAATSAGTGSNDARQLAARALGLTALRDVAGTSDAFEAERAALARLWRGNDDLAALASWSRAGAPTRDDLGETYPGDAIREAAGPGRAFFGLIEVRRADPGDSGTGALAITVLVESRLAENDLVAAVTMTERLEGDALAAAQAWLLSANARMDIDAHLSSLRQALTEQAAAQGADPS
jgi:hypothetical protein